MNQHFKSGDLVILQYATYYTENDGYPGIVIEAPSYRVALDLNTMKFRGSYCYSVRVLKGADCLHREGLVVNATHYQLRKLDGESDQHCHNEESLLLLTEEN